MITRIGPLILALALSACPASTPTKDPAAADPGTPVATGKCQVTGCSGQICSDQEVVTTCEYRPEYACLKCMQCTDTGAGCRWVATPDTQACRERTPGCGSSGSDPLHF